MLGEENMHPGIFACQKAKYCLPKSQNANATPAAAARRRPPPPQPARPSPVPARPGMFAFVVPLFLFGVLVLVSLPSL
jgi:hypothetical protein